MSPGQNKERKQEMKVDKVIEVPDGTLTFQGELTEKELALVVEYGLNTLLALGAIKPQIVYDNDDTDEAEETPTNLQ